MSQASSSSNTAELLSPFRDQQAKHDENRVEVGAVSGACFVYHLKGCDQCSTYVEHLLADIDQHPAKFSFPRDEILDQIHEVWPHVSGYITEINDEHETLENELFQEKVDNHQLRNDLDDLKERIQGLEAQLSSLQSSNTVSEHSMMLTSPTDYNSTVSSAHPLASPTKVTYSHKRSRKLDENTDFRNHVLKPEEWPDHWSLHMWQALLGWHKNPMSVPNAIRDDPDGYFLEEDSSLAAVSILRRYLVSQIIKGTKDNTQTTTSVRLSHGAEFLTLLLKHCSLSRAQIYNHIILYMERDEEKRPMSAAGMEQATYMLLHQSAPAPNKGKKLLTGHKAYNNQREPILPYSEEPPSGEPDVEMHGPTAVGVRGTLPEESTMNIDPEMEDLYE
ncbi:hypothetical protein M422DRAFT_255152 [Sphaerobolus stellatus SS14]|uniref:Uncharacterized protein n=1 Tax=Sphaerobolus stellatus (strain SS14) TaxID=990650 RepID=A0A0C9UFP8_SPHS4|nr:hypothetical protein M422DRAFT_255152 [Sphaerobolus stellatus SS14]